MSTQILPKKRGQHSGNAHNNRVSSIHDLSNKGRAISGRVSSKSKRAPSGARHVSRGDLFVTRPDESNSLLDDAIHFDENKHTILSNFEEWIKLSTDNKITSKNSWQFALIDYFHDLNVIKDGENINFQRASATLDGCVKIYSSRVESVASETGKLLSGLATKKGQAGADDDDDELDENGEPIGEADESTAEAGDGKKKRKINRILESTLVEPDAIRIKKLDQELAIDPLFKKALAEFDEGGAKSLLLNTLSIDNSGRVVFDATTNQANDNVDEINGEDPENDPVGNNQDESEVEEGDRHHKSLTNISSMDIDDADANINLDGLSKFLYQNSPEELDDITICPSLNELKLVLKDVNKAKTLLSDVNSKFMQEDDRASNAPETPAAFDDQFGFNDYDDGDFGGDDNDEGDNDNHDHEGDGGLHTSLYDGISRLFRSADDSEEEEVMTTKVLDQDLMSYFDERMKTNWRGPEHWKVTNLKKAKNISDNPATVSNGSESNGNDNENTTDSLAASKKKKKEGTIIDFFSFEDQSDLEDIIFQQPKNPALLDIKPQDRVSESKQKLPEDIKYNSRKLTHHFAKADKPLSHFTKKQKNTFEQGLENQEEPGLTDENYFSKQYQKEEEEKRQQEQLAASFQQAEYEDYDNDDFGDVNFNDALGGADDGHDDNEIKSEEATGSTQRITGGHKARPEYVNFSRVAKRVDVKLLKDNLWTSISQAEQKEADTTKQEDEVDTNKQETDNEGAQEETEMKKEKKFADVITSIGTMYRPEEKKDLSTSFCFICLLHLANEHGLQISNTATHDDLRITGF